MPNKTLFMLPSSLMQRVCFCKTVSLFNHVLQPSQALALFYQSLVFSLKNLALVRWISSNVDIPNGLQLLMIDLNGNVTVDDELFYKQFSSAKRDVEQPSDTTSILRWISRIVFRLASDCSISSKLDRSLEFESFNEFLKQFHTISADDRSTLSDDDEGISSDDLDDEDISRKAIHRALMATLWRNVTAEYLQFSDQSQLRKVSLDNYGNLNSSIDNNRRWSIRENDRVLDEIAKRQQNLRKTVTLDRRDESDHMCLHDRLMSEIKQKRILKSIVDQSLISTTSLDSSRKRIRPVKNLIESDLSSDDQDDELQRDEHGRKRVAVIDCLLESSSPSSAEDIADSTISFYVF
ncbi:unnamed protein product [Rotaria magnacalcarata]|uniref:Uncharacterized protein n=2 Tax=Rotaria magnacalcarata TaxID=392030 RepID=A0A8S2PX46_9BILA|nr:unnamed protein product [Rotaria magnacalcarata]